LDASNHDTVASRHWQYYAGDIGKLITESLEIYLIGITDGETPDDGETIDARFGKGN
jgi:hypothetical protein